MAGVRNPSGKSQVAIGFPRNTGTDPPRDWVQLLLERGSYGPLCSCADPEWGGGSPDPAEKSQKYSVSQQNWSGSHENHKTTKPAFNVGPSSARQRNAIKMAFRWQADDGPLIVVFGSSLPSSTKTRGPDLKRSPDLLNNVKIGQDQLRLIMKHI